MRDPKARYRAAAAVRRERALAAQLCTRCAKRPPQPGRMTCRPCIELVIENRRVKIGIICLTCGGELGDRVGMQLCEKCRDSQTIKRRALKQELKAKGLCVKCATGPLHTKTLCVRCAARECERQRHRRGVTTPSEREAMGVRYYYCRKCRALGIPPSMPPHNARAHEQFIERQAGMVNVEP